MKQLTLLKLAVILVLFALVQPNLTGQEPVNPTMQPMRTGATNMQAGTLSSPALDRMADSMTSMAEMCKMMMDKEMRWWPLKVSVLGIIGTLGTAALVIFVILEAQCVRFLGLRIKAEKSKR